MNLHDKINDLFSQKDIKNLVKNTLKNSSILKEAYVVQKNKFSLVTETLSEKTKKAHLELYSNYVEDLNKISSKIDALKNEDYGSNHSPAKTLKKDESFNLNASWLHELYFENCFDPNSEIVMNTLSFIKIQRDFGTFEKWQEDFMITALSAGNGWVVCGYNIFLNKYINTFITDHSTDVMMGMFPVIVIDMWQHAYFKDYLNDKKSYLTSQMQEINWDVVEERVQKAEKIAQVLK